MAAYDATNGGWTELQMAPDQSSGSLAAAGHTVLFSGAYRTVHLYDLQTHNLITHALNGASGAEVAPIATAVDGLVVFDTGDIYDSNTGQWSQTDSLEREGYVSDVAVTAGDLAIFGGGATITSGGQAQATGAVHIYNARTGDWSTASLSQPRFGMAAASVGDLVLFAGGGPDAVAATDTVDIYNVRTGAWSVARLSAPRNGLAAAAVGNLAIFAGGQVDNQESDRVDVYDAATGQWFTSSISVARSELAGTTAGGKSLFTGGIHVSYGPPNASPQVVEVFSPVAGVLGSVSGKAGSKMKLTVQTNGDAALPPGATISLYASPDGTLTGATPIGTAILSSGLAAQSSTKLSTRTSLASVPSGRYRVIAAADDSTGLGAVVIASQSKLFKVHARTAHKAAATAASRFRGLFAR